MAYRPLKEYPEDNEIWRWLTKNINDALDFLNGLATRVLGEKNSIVLDEDDKKIQLVNDLTDAELQALGYGTVYGTVEDGTKGFKKDLGGYIGTKEVDETNIADGKTIKYDATSEKMVYTAFPTSTASGRASYFVIPYHLYRGEYEGNIHFQLQIGTTKDFSGTLDYDLDTADSQANFITFDGVEWADFLSTGMPTTYLQAAITGLEFATTALRYIRWRTYYLNEEEEPVYGDWAGGII
jgi:hypothetical protein